MKTVLLAAIDQSTTSTKFLVFNTLGQLIVKEMIDHEQITPHQGWLEHNPLQILANLRKVQENAYDSLIKLDIEPACIKTIGITNQRETTVAWNKVSGSAYTNAIVWNDMRTANICKRILEKHNNNKNYFKQKNGLPINTYFSAFKIQWMIENCKPLEQDLLEKPEQVLFGTMDSWVLWNLSGNHLTDVSNASRTFLMNLETLKWDQDLLKQFNINEQNLPQILPSGAEFGSITNGPFKGITINAILGDQMAACIGHGLFKQGQSKNTYGTGLFLLSNIGEKLRITDEGLLTSVLYQKNHHTKPVYGFEGAVECGGSTINWTRDKMKLFETYEQLNQAVSEVPDNGGVYFVPAFSGLYTPYWNENATGVIIGLSLHTQRQHILRALFEAICLRTKDVIDVMENIANIKIEKLNIDGGITENDLLMQMQADILQKNLSKPQVTDSTCLGVALFAGLATNIFHSEEEIINLINVKKEFIHNTENAQGSSQLYEGWQKAIQRSLNWNN